MRLKEEEMGGSKAETVLPELERLLINTAAAQVHGAAASRGNGSGKRGLRRLSALGVPRLAALGFALVLFGGTAMAATGVWHPSIGGITGAPAATTSGSPVPPAITGVLGILRREQTAKDRSAEVEATLSRALYVDGIRPRSVRYLAPSEAEGEAIVLFSVQRPNPVQGEASEQICLHRPMHATTTRQPPKCVGLDSLLSGGAFMTFESFSPKYNEAVKSGSSGVLIKCSERPPPAFCLPVDGTAVGLVPDGVAAVTAKFSGAPNVTVPVDENYFEIPLHGAELTHDPVGVRYVVWRDAKGQVVRQRPLEG